MKPTYAECFWSKEFLSTVGFDIFCARNRDGKRFCKELEDYFKQRSKMELEYVKALQNLAKSMKIKDESGTLLERTWNTLRTETETMAVIHIEAGSFLQQHAEAIHQFCEEQKKRNAQYEERMKKSQQNKANLHNKMQNAHKEYFKKCKEADNASENYEAVRYQVSTKTKDLEKALQRLERCKEEARRADEAYKSSVELLEDARSTWEQDWKESCQAFQQHDEERIAYLREMMWNAANTDSKVAVDVDECAEQLRLMLEGVDVEKDVNIFIENNKTGSEHPASIPYVNYYPQENGKQKSPVQTSRQPQPVPVTFPQNDGLYSSVNDL